MFTVTVLVELFLEVCHKNCLSAFIEIAIIQTVNKLRMEFVLVPKLCIGGKLT